MWNKCNIGSIVICAMAIMLEFVAQARTFEFKQLKSTGTTGSAEYWWEGTEKSKSSWFQVKIGGATKIDDTSEMEIRAATVLKSVKDKKTGINDVATFEFDPINKGKAIFFMISTGSAFSRERDSYYYGNVSTGWQLAGVIIEIWQKGKVVKHWSNMSGKDGKTKLTENIKKLRINRDGHPCEGERYYSAKDFDNATEIYSVDQKGERVDIDEVLKPFRESEEGGKAASKGDDTSAAQTSVKNTVAPKLRTCEFLLNKKFKKNAKFYLCLFSASWCPPCRAEMPRIAKTYAETLKDDPDIELIHFSRDQDEEKAMAWAKEHDVKFPVVRPRGGNPLDLHTRGIPHLFIVKADGTLIEEGHPMNIFNEEKFREIKGGGSISTPAPQTCKVNVTGDEGSQSTGRNVAAQKLRDCEFLLNKDFKKNAKFYLCLFSASWCPPCRREMPRIAKTYAEMLKDDPDIELIHFSRDQNDEKALAWAKEHDVKFPVVKPNGGNPLELHCNGIPHLFIVKADGTLVEEGHPMRIFNEEKFRELKGGDSLGCAKPQAGNGLSVNSKATVVLDGYTWSYSSDNEEATIVSPTGKLYERGVSPCPTGDLVIPSLVDGKPVTGIGKFALCNCPGVTSIEIPPSVTRIGEWAFSGCSKLTAVTLPSGLTDIKECAFANCPNLLAIGLEAANPTYKVVDGILYTKDMKRLVTGPGGLTSVLIPSGIEDVGDHAFRCCRKLKSVTIPMGVKRLGRDAFCGTALESIVIPSTVESIGGWAFWCCSGLKSVVMTEGLRSIGRMSFYQCRGLESVMIPSSVRKVEYEAFYDCSKLTSVTMCGERPEAEDKVFENCDKLAAIHVPANAKSWAGMKEWQGKPLVFDAKAK